MTGDDDAQENNGGNLLNVVEEIIVFAKEFPNPEHAPDFTGL